MANAQNCGQIKSTILKLQKFNYENWSKNESLYGSNVMKLYLMNLFSKAENWLEIDWISYLLAIGRLCKKIIVFKNLIFNNLSGIFPFILFNCKHAVNMVSFSVGLSFVCHLLNWSECTDHFMVSNKRSAVFCHSVYFNNIY